MRQKIAVLVAGFLGSILISTFHYYFALPLTPLPFYLLVIGLATLYTGDGAGFFLSAYSIALWMVADLYKSGATVTPYLYWNAIFYFAIMAVFVYFLGKYRDYSFLYREQSLLDPLTGIANRTGFFELAGKEVRRAQRYGRAFSVACLDVNNLKEVNDRLGQRIGDFLIQTVARILKQHLRSSDVVARISGDEFILLFSETGEASVEVMDKLQKKLLSIMKKNEWPVGFSVGVVTFLTPPESVDLLVRSSTSLMEEAKLSGPNRIQHEVIGGSPGSSR